MPDAQKGNIDGGSALSSSGTGVQAKAGTDSVTDQDVATRYGLSEDQVHAFCREFNVPTIGDHYAIPQAMLPRLESWAQQKGYAKGGT